MVFTDIQIFSWLPVSKSVFFPYRHVFTMIVFGAFFFVSSCALHDGQKTHNIINRHGTSFLSEDITPDKGQLTGRNYVISLIPSLGNDPEEDSGVHYNEQSLKTYTLNKCFFSPIDKKEMASDRDCRKVKRIIRRLKERAERRSLNPDREMRKGSSWGQIVREFKRSFRKEKGAITYSVQPKFIGWIYCGWILLNETFLHKEGFFRMCAKAHTVGIDVFRLPIPGLDFSFLTTTLSLSAYNPSTAIDVNLNGPGMLLNIPNLLTLSPS